MKKLLTVTMILFFITSSVNASSIRGDFEGNPIVSVKTNGNELKLEDVPAINYNGRTMVPIYMLRELGADVAWDASNYTVNVSFNKTDTETDQQLEKEDKENLKKVYVWLSDTDLSMWMYAVKLQQYSQMDKINDIGEKLDRDYLELTEEYNKTLAIAKAEYDKNKSSTKINEILSSQSKAYQQLGQTKDLLKVWLPRKEDATITLSLQISTMNALELTQKNVSFTKYILHELK